MKQKKADYDYQIKITKRFILFTKIRVYYEAFLEICGPVLGLLSLLLKLHLLSFATNKQFYQWTLLDVIKFLGFLNQITSIRDINRMELDTLEHFIFSNKKCKLEDKEKTMMNNWWDRVIVSAVATSDQCKGSSPGNLLNSIAYWCSLTREKMEQLMKRDNIDIEGINRIGDTTMGGNEIKLIRFSDTIKPRYEQVREDIRAYLASSGLYIHAD